MADVEEQDLGYFGLLSESDRSRLRLREGSKITVCSECKRACCWCGIFMCEDARGASTVEITIAQARALGREHPDYWLTLREEEGYSVPRKVVEARKEVRGDR